MLPADRARSTVAISKVHAIVRRGRLRPAVLSRVHSVDIDDAEPVVLRSKIGAPIVQLLFFEKLLDVPQLIDDRNNIEFFLKALRADHVQFCDALVLKPETARAEVIREEYFCTLACAEFGYAIFVVGFTGPVS